MSIRFDASGFYSERSDNDLLAKVESIPSIKYDLVKNAKHRDRNDRWNGLHGSGMSAPGVAEKKMWIWQEYGLPIREETTIPSTTRTDMKNIELSDIPDRMFELPAGA